MIREWNLSETNLGRVENRHYEVAVIPTAAIEPHNRHLPYGQDWRHTTYVAEQSCELAWEKTESVLCLPTIPYGVDCNLQDFPLAIHVSQKTLDDLLRDVIRSLHRSGVFKIVILNGHGGNDFGPLIRQVQCDLDVHVFVCDWWKAGQDQYDTLFSLPDDHAGELETSVALHLYPELVELEAAGDGEARPFRFQALREGWVRTSRRFSRLNDHCAVGNPFHARAEKGSRYLSLVCRRIADFLTELAESPIDHSFPQESSGD